jgi:capsular polysaccharide biosynthesis protein
MLIARKKPVNLCIGDERLFSQEFQKEIPLPSMRHIKNCCVNAQGVVFKGFKADPDSFVSKRFAQNATWKFFAKSYILSKHFEIPSKKPAILFFDSWSEGYFHWICDALPRLFLAKEHLMKSIILTNDLFTKDYHTSTLSLFPILESYVLQRGKTYHVKELLLPSHLAETTGNYNEGIMQSMRSYLLQQLKIDDSIGNLHKKIYITRKNASRRKVINESDLWPVLKKYGFLEMAFENLSFVDQAKTAFSAQVIIGLHGAGLSNILFMKPKSKLLELRRENESHDNCYFSLASALDIDYYYLKCKPTNPLLSNQDADVIVDVDKFEALLKMIA